MKTRSLNNPTIGDLTSNAEQILAAAEQAAHQGVSLLLTGTFSVWLSTSRLAARPQVYWGDSNYVATVSRKFAAGVGCVGGLRWAKWAIAYFWW